MPPEGGPCVITKDGKRGNRHVVAMRHRHVQSETDPVKRAEKTLGRRDCHVQHISESLVECIERGLGEQRG